MACIDYHKGLDSIPHSHILPHSWINNLWKATLTHQNGNLKSKPIQMNSGIFQGDSLSPFLFCLSLIPFSKELNRTGYGCSIQKRNINHPFSIDDLKLLVNNKEV